MAWFSVARRWHSVTAAAIVLAMALWMMPAGVLAAPAPPSCQFLLGFATMATLIPQQVGRCLDNEQHDARSGDALQHTAGGLLVWRKADNFTAFTNGATTWVNGPQGIQARPNGQRFPWEANPSGLPLVPPAPTVPAIARTGKVIIIGLQAQSLTAYENGAVVLVTPVTTGRPALPTPPGQGSVFYRSSPYEFISPWSQDSPYYYPPSWVNWALEFFGGGYFMHDAPWEPANAFGPGSEYGPYASHGCVHVPTEAMRFLYQWGQLGTKVVVEW